MAGMPGINHQDAIRALGKAGFRVIRQGKHIVLSNGDRQVTIPRHNPIKAFTMGGIIRGAGLTLDELRVLLQTCRLGSDPAYETDIMVNLTLKPGRAE